MAIEVNLRFTNLDQVRAELRAVPDRVDRAAQLAINDTLRFGRTRIVEKVREVATVKARAIRTRITLVRAGTKSLRGIIRILDTAIPLIDFKARKTKKGVAYTLSEGQVVLLRSAYIRKTRKRGRQVLRRKADDSTPSGLVGRLPTYMRYGPSLLDLFNDFIDGFTLDLTERLDRNFTRQLNRLVLT